jgi:hypothetical protein
VPRPDIDPGDARLELARRHLHIFGPTTSSAFAEWAGIPPNAGRRTFDALAAEITAVRTPTGEAWILAADEATFRAPARPAAPARLLPSGDTYFLLQGAHRELLVPDAARRPELWTPRVWPGAVLVEGEIVGTWRRAQEKVTIQSWRRLTSSEREAVETEAASLPVPALRGGIRVLWEG